MDNWKAIDKSIFSVGDIYIFEYNGSVWDKVYIGENEKGVLMFRHTDNDGDERTSFVTPEKTLKNLFITKKQI